MFRFLRFPIGKPTLLRAEMYISRKENLCFRPEKHKQQENTCPISVGYFNLYFVVLSGLQGLVDEMRASKRTMTLCGAPAEALCLRRML